MTTIDLAITLYVLGYFSTNSMYRQAYKNDRAIAAFVLIFWPLITAINLVANMLEAVFK